MPLYYVGWACCATDDGSDLYATRGPGRYVRYESDHPYEGFPQLPADYFVTRETHYRSDDELVDYLEKSGARYCHGRIYLNYSGELDLQVDYNGGYFKEGGYTAVYILAMPTRPADIPDDEDYPEAKWWYYATGRRFAYYLRYEDYLRQLQWSMADGFEGLYQSADAVPSIGS